MTTLVTEPFTYSNGALETVASANWANIGGQAMNVVSNAIKYAGNASGESLYANKQTLATANNWAQIVVTGGSGYSEMGPVWRQTAASGSTKTCYIAPLSNNGLQLYSVVSGSYTEIGSYAAGSTSGTVYGEAQGTAVKVFLDGVQRISVTNSAVASGNFAGVEAYATGSGCVGDTFTAGDFSSGSVALTAADSFLAVTCDTGALTQHQILAAADSAVAVTSDSGGLVQHQVLVAQDSTVTTSCDTAALVQHTALVASDSAVAVTCTTGALTQHQVLDAADSTVEVISSSANLTQHHVLTAADSTVTTTCDGAVLVQHHVLVGDDSLITVSSDNGTLTVAGQLAAEDCLVLVTCDTGALVQHHALTAQGSLVTTSCDSAVLTAHNAVALTGQDCTVTVTCDHATLGPASTGIRLGAVDLVGMALGDGQLVAVALGADQVWP